MRRAFWLLPSLFATLASAGPPPTRVEELADFARVKEQVVAMSPEADFTVLRELWTRTPQYNPMLDISDAYQVNIAAMRKALGASDRASAIALCNQYLDEYLVDLRWHLRCADACREGGASKRLEFHEYMIRGLTRSIMSRGDGSSPATAYWVISYAEQYAVFAVEGVEKLEQELVEASGKHYDAILVRDKSTGEQRTVYFAVDSLLGWSGPPGP